MSLIQRLRDSIKMLIWRGGAHYEVEIKRLDARVDKLESLTLPNIQEFKGAEERIRRLDARVDKLKSLTLPAIEDIKKSISSSSGRNPRFYDELRMFTYLLDKEFSVEQKKWFIEKQSMKALGYFPDLDNPKSVNEKTQWYKLNYQDKRMTELADKFKFKDIVSDAIGKGRTARLLGVWSSAREVDFESLPNSFVLKSNWGSGSRHVLIVKDKSNIDINRVRMQLSNWLQPWENVYFHTFDWAYKDINPKIIAEEFLIDKGYEYNFFCFNGEPEYCYAITGGVAKGVPKRRSYYNKDWDLFRHSPSGVPTDVKIA
jgi:hypothetical protein